MTGMVPGTLAPDALWRLEERALNAWPALQTAHVDGWLLRFAEGFTKRANSACALPGAAPLAAVLPEIEARYRARGLPCCIRLTPFAPAGSASALASRDWRIIDETLIQVATIGAASPSALPELELASVPSPAWIDGFADASERAGLRRDILARMLEAIGTPAAFATLADQGEPVAYGMAVRERGAVGLFDIATRAAHRGRGHGGRLVAGLLGWAAEAGDRQAYLQVTATNRAALALYGRHGFAEAYRYAYAVPRD